MRKFLLIAIGCIVCGLETKAQVPALERVEPMFWWTGMSNPKLQLIVHGRNIAAKSVQLVYPGVKLTAVHKVENPNYLFLDLQIFSSARPGTFPIKFIQPGEKDLVYNYSLKERSHAANRAQGVTSKDFIYLLMPDRFSNGDPSNDDVAGMRERGIHRDSMFSRHGGDIKGLMNHLSYLKDLGVTAVWMTPEIENDEPAASYHGYAVTDYYKIDPRYGTNELYKQYVEACHRLGLKVIKDLVHNHIGTESYLIRDMPMKSWVHQWPKYTNSNFRDMVVMDPHASAKDRKIMLDGWFDKRMADLNENNPYVQNYLTQNHIWWVEYAGIDGFRLDTYPYNDPDYMAKWAQDVQREFPKLSIYGETLVWSAANQAFFLGGNVVNRGLDTHLPGVTDAVVKDAIYEALNGKEGWTDGVNRIYAVLAQDFLYKDPTKNVIFLDNHDMSRFYSMVNEDMAKYKSGLALLLTLRGIPQMYYGDEILMKNFSNPDGLVREDFPGGWPGDKDNKFTADGRSKKENEAFNYLRTLANYRKNTPALQTGKLMQFIPRDGVYVYFRYDQQKTVMVVYNSRDKEQTLATDYYAERINNSNQAKDIFSTQTIDIKKLLVPAKTTLILELIPAK
ncbi:glycoside hydrolase family 13 protein [Mucilaginibacter sp. RS28]|uniref:Glycoside hydrolase family 13 protein n=1 Tax=Mucilaginibacter straminoryzae TaxID=2932774 RepID=A0A9X1X1E0_9SPHI|nr:glycoside hydrolase family 13 protein [Mucilaginibacter straminoryzae]MCJ8209273.1 glycoside hydrolase family 13 protein [Mucilaginibacter straminoryzae]